MGNARALMHAGLALFTSGGSTTSPSGDRRRRERLHEDFFRYFDTQAECGHSPRGHLESQDVLDGIEWTREFAGRLPRTAPLRDQGVELSGKRSCVGRAGGGDLLDYE